MWIANYGLNHRQHVFAVSGFTVKHSNVLLNRRRKGQLQKEVLPSGSSIDRLTWTFTTQALTSELKAVSDSIDYQSDTKMYGRGEMHLSAMLEEGDIVVYQTGTWEVDGVEVGDGNPASYELCVVETMQVIWTHNCEHGFIRGMAATINASGALVEEAGTSTDHAHKIEVTLPLEFVDFGPEQLIARLPVNWINDDEAQLLVDLPAMLQNE